MTTTASGRSSASPMSASIRPAIRMTGASRISSGTREHVERFGLTLDMVQLPLSSRPIEEQDSPHILTARDPERQREIDSICRLIERIGAGRHPGGEIQPQHHRHPAHRARAGPRRLDATPTFRWAKADQDAPPGHGRHGERGGELGADRRLPRAPSSRSRLREGAARLPSARPLHAAGLQGRHARARHGRGAEALRARCTRARITGSISARARSGEMLDDPGARDHRRDPLVRQRGKIFNVHFRNIKGRKLDFMEVVPRRGQHGHGALGRASIARSATSYMLMPDHVPHIARPRPVRHGVRLLLRLYPRADGRDA